MDFLGEGGWMSLTSGLAWLHSHFLEPQLSHLDPHSDEAHNNHEKSDSTPRNQGELTVTPSHIQTEGTNTQSL